MRNRTPVQSDDVFSSFSIKCILLWLLPDQSPATPWNLWYCVSYAKINSNSAVSTKNAELRQCQCQTVEQPSWHHAFWPTSDCIVLFARSSRISLRVGHNYAWFRLYSFWRISLWSNSQLLNKFLLTLSDADSERIAIKFGLKPKRHCRFHPSFAGWTPRWAWLGHSSKIPQNAIGFVVITTKLKESTVGIFWFRGWFSAVYSLRNTFV
jgi:hypothetical protein